MHGATIKIKDVLFSLLTSFGFLCHEYFASCEVFFQIIGTFNHHTEQQLKRTVVCKSL